MSICAEFIQFRDKGTSCNLFFLWGGICSTTIPSHDCIVVRRASVPPPAGDAVASRLVRVHATVVALHSASDHAA